MIVCNYDLFHISFFKKSYRDQQSVIVDLKYVQLQPNLTYKEWLVQIIDWKDQELRNWKIPLVKVLW